jgi:hypothetical protein
MSSQSIRSVANLEPTEETEESRLHKICPCLIKSQFSLDFFN